jgi:hypothetical protein
MMTQANAVPTAADLNNMFPELSGFADLAQDDLMAVDGGTNWGQVLTGVGVVAMAAGAIAAGPIELPAFIFYSAAYFAGGGIIASAF